MLNELYTRFDQLENFLKGGNKFTSQCIDLQKRSKMVEDSQEYILAFAKNLNNIQNREKYLSFQPVLGKFIINNLYLFHQSQSKSLNN